MFQVETDKEDVMGYLKIAFILLIWIATPSAFALERIEFYNGARGLAMGGAYVTTVNDETALILNPAGLGKLRDKYITLIDPEIGLGEKTQEMIGYDITSGMNPQKAIDNVNTRAIGDRFHQDMKIFPSLIFPNFGIGLLYSLQTNGEKVGDGTNTQVDYVEDYAAVLGYNFRIWDGIIKIGFNAKIVNHTEIRGEFASTTTDLSVDSNGVEGVGVSSDVGLLLQAPWMLLPTIGAVARDAGGTVYNIQDGIFHTTTARPATKKQTIDAGFAIFPITGKGNRMTITGELRDVMDVAEENDTARRTHYGLEFNFRDVFFIRGGMNQGYWTAGIEFAVLNYQFQATSYGEEVGTTADRKEDRRYVGKFSWRF